MSLKKPKCIQNHYWCVWFRREVVKKEISEREYGKREIDEI